MEKVKAKHLLIVKTQLTIKQQEKIVEAINKKRNDFIVIFSEDFEYYKLD